MNLKRRTDTFVELGKQLSEFILNPNKSHTELREAIQQSYLYNNWFTEDQVIVMLQSIADSLNETSLNQWLSHYDQNKLEQTSDRKIAVIMAGNIPVVGFHDFLSILICGFKFQGKLSSQDRFLLPALTQILIKIEPEFTNRIEFTEQKIGDMQAIIATGSNNSARYFEHYFSRYPHIIRKNRNSVAVLSGTENATQLKHLADDVFMYYGLGCRNVSKLFVPKGYDFEPFFNATDPYKQFITHHKYANNYNYHKTILLMNQTPLLDTGFFVMQQAEQLGSPVSVIYYEFYDDVSTLNIKLQSMNEELQCIVSDIPEIENRIALGQAQQPNLWDYADGIDTIEFLLGI